jgi:epoxyqueuosine reductase
MVAIFQADITAEQIRSRATSLGADLVGIADGAVLEAYPPDPARPQRPSDITAMDCDRVIVLAKHYPAGTTRLARWNERHKYYNDELALSILEEVSLELVYWLEDKGFPAIIIPPTHVDPWRYKGDPAAHMSNILSLTHAAVEAGMGTLGLNQQLLTPEYGPRLLLSAVLCSAPVTPDIKMEQALCLGPTCGRCLQACPGDVVGHWDRDWAACDRYRSPHGFAQLTEHLDRIISEPDPALKKKLLRTEDSFYIWQSILRGAGVVTGCRRCQDVCPVGADYDQLLRDALDVIPEGTPQKQERLDDMTKSEERGELPESYIKASRWIGTLDPLPKEPSTPSDASS